MKKGLISTTLITIFGASLNAQATSDSVSISAGYAQNSWYQLSEGSVHSHVKNDWDLAFQISGMASTIRINSAEGMQLWLYPQNDTAHWSTLDTAGISGWEELFNSDESWELGAFSRNADASNAMDLGWGIYSVATHHVNGNRLFVLKKANGSYIKIHIERLAGGVYHFRYANLDNSNLQQAQLDKAQFNGKVFGYYDLANHQSIDREPLAQDWDLFFGQYQAFVPIPYNVTGVLIHPQAKVVKAYPVNDVENYEDYSAHTFETNISTIGHTWKSINMSTFAWDIQDSLVYFVETQNEAIWKLVFTGFGGSSTGNYYFTKELLRSGLGSEQWENQNTVFEMYPNPLSNGQQLNVVISDKNNDPNAALSLWDIQGKQHARWSVSNANSLMAQQLDLPHLANGIYVLYYEANGKRTSHKLIIQK